MNTVSVRSHTRKLPVKPPKPADPLARQIEAIKPHTLAARMKPREEWATRKFRLPRWVRRSLELVWGK